MKELACPPKVCGSPDYLPKSHGLKRNRPRDTDTQGRETDRGTERETDKGFLVLILTHAEAFHHERHSRRITDVS